jgi:hypothetical protein
MAYDSADDTLKHIENVEVNIGKVIMLLQQRAKHHDLSKLDPSEKAYFDFFTPRLAGTTYGSDEYKDLLGCLKPALKHHYANNRHHPEFFSGGISDMTLIDLIEMLCDWKAATLRHNDGDMGRSLEINAKRFNMTFGQIQMLRNTCLALGWISKEENDGH